MEMLNVLLDGFPDSYKGNKINTSFRVGVLLSQLLKDEEIPFEIKYAQAIELLYKDKVEDVETAINGIKWFVSCGKSEIYHIDAEEKSNTDEESLDFDEDQLDIWATFKMIGIDLSIEKDLHWFKFMAILSNLGECPLGNKMGYRVMDLSDMKGETRKHYQKIKNRCRIRKAYTKEEYEAYLAEIENKNGSYYSKLLRLQNE